MMTRCLTVALVLATTTAAPAQTPPPLLSPLAQPPAAAVTWEAAERAKNPMITQSAFVAVDTALLRALPTFGAAPLGSFGLALPTGHVTVQVTSTDVMYGYRTFRAHVPGQTSTLVLAMADSGEVNALIDIADAQYALVPTPAAGVHVLQVLDADLLPATMACGTDHTHVVSAAAPATPSLLGGGNSDCSLTTLDVMVFYTPAARAGAGGVAAMETAIVSAIEQANEGHRESGAPIEFRLVHAAETVFTEAGTSSDLYAFRNDGDGVMDEVHTLRDDYGADLMHLIIEPPAAFCGIGFLMGAPSTGFEDYAFAVTVRTCISNRSFTHECGHNMGCHHDIANASGTPSFPYSYGYRTPDNAYRTIMAYAPGTRVNRWSSPNVLYQGYTMGVAGSADNVLSITNTCATVALFRATQAPRWCQLGGGIAGANGKPTLVGAGTINQVAALELTVDNYGSIGVGVLILGLQAVDLPLFGGTLVPSLDLLVTLVGSGAPLPQDASWLVPLPPGSEVWCQAAFLDAAAPQGLSASDGVRVTRP